MDLSIIIPTYQRHAKLGACVAALAAQETSAEFEVLIGVDGEDPGAEAAARSAWQGQPAERLVVRQGPKAGLAAVRNRMIPLLRGRTVVSLNDDVLVQTGFLEAHLTAQRDAARGAGDRPAIIVGRSPWLVREPDDAFSRLIRETSMVFFHDVMDRETDPDRDWGFRHAWPLNLSVPATVVKDLGGWTVFPATYGYEDDEFAYRAAERFGTRVLYRPGAVALHDHFMTPREYLEREYKLGYAGLGFARSAPGCGRAMFGRDLTAEQEYSEEFVRHQAADARRLWPAFASWGDQPAAVFGGPQGALLRTLAYQQHLLLKRWVWRSGLRDAFAGRAMDPGVTLATLSG